MTPEEHFLAELSKRLPANANLSTFDLYEVLEACGLELSKKDQFRQIGLWDLHHALEKED